MTAWGTPLFDGLYHTVKTQAVKIPETDQYTQSAIEATGFYKGEMKKGDIVQFGHFANSPQHVIKELVERRDHKGIFPDPDDAKGSFFHVKF